MKETFYKITAKVNLTVALISDLHNRTGTEVLKSLRQQRPDIITVAGDMIVGFRSTIAGIANEDLLIDGQENVIPFLRSCTYIAPTFISLGNHEWFLSDEDIEKIASSGAVLLDNRWVTHFIRGQKILLGGLTSVFIDNYRLFRQNAGTRYPIPPKNEKPLIKDPDSSWIDHFERQDGYKVFTIRSIGAYGNRNCMIGILIWFYPVMHTGVRCVYWVKDFMRQDKAFSQHIQKECGWVDMEG